MSTRRLRRMRKIPAMGGEGVCQRCRPLLLAVAVGVFFLSGCVSPRTVKSQLPVEPQVIQSATRFRKEYVLAPGDQIEVLVRRVPEASRAAAIRPDGYITLPLLDDVAAAGLTPQELDQKLTQLLSARLVEPEVTVIPTQIRQPAVYVTGDVGNPAAVPLREAPTAMQAIAFAGGLRRSAATRDIVLIRLTQDGYVRAIPIPVEKNGQPGPYMVLRSTLLEADDILFVPESGRSQFSRFIDDIITRPLTVVNQIIGVYANFRLVQELNK